VGPFEIQPGDSLMEAVTLSATGLSPSLYNSRVVTHSNDLDQPDILTPVTLLVTAPPTPDIRQTPPNVADTMLAGESAIHYLKVKNVGTAQLTVSFSDSAAWITESIGPFTIQPNDSLTEAVTLNAAGLAPSLYNSVVVTSSNDPDQPSILLPVALLVESPPVPHLYYYPASVNDSTVEGSVISWNLVIRNQGTGNLIVGLGATENNITAIARPGSETPSGNVDLALSNSSGEGIPHILNTWLFVFPSADTLSPPESLVAEIRLDARFIGADAYTGQINLTSNDPDTPTATIPVSLLVSPAGSTCHYIVGDVNASNIFNGIDVTYAVSYLKDGPAPPYSCECTPGNFLYVAGDVNGSCSFNGMDVTCMVSFFKGGSDVTPCPNCPPVAAMGIPSGDISPASVPVSRQKESIK
jgi:hypothetical protein